MIFGALLGIMGMLSRQPWLPTEITPTIPEGKWAVEVMATIEHEDGEREVRMLYTNGKGHFYGTSAKVIAWQYPPEPLP